MLLVVDANILISCLMKRSRTFDIFLINRVLKKFEFVAPEFLLVEIEKNTAEILKRSKLSAEEFGEVLEFLREEITFLQHSEFSDSISKAREISPDHKDVQYFALALKLNCPIFSNDEALKNQSKVEIFSTEDLLKALSSSIL